MRSRIFLLAVLAACALPAAHAAGAVHKWVDEDGEVVYSQFPPSDRERPSEIVPPPPPPAESPAAARERLNQRLQQFADNREDRELAAEEAAQAEQQAELARQRCAAARHRLAGFDGRARQLFRMPDGEYRRLTPEEREAQRAEMEQIIAEDCR
jgi:hypothetical protein